jgi:hypothetical protein
MPFCFLDFDFIFSFFSDRTFIFCSLGDVERWGQRGVDGEVEGRNLRIHFWSDITFEWLLLDQHLQRREKERIQVTIGYHNKAVLGEVAQN